MQLESGTKLGPYEILAPLGAGGMGEVWKAKDTRLDRLVAIKVLPEHLTANPDALARFEREAKAVAALNHPNILGIFDIGTHEGHSYAVMELLEGESLRDRLRLGPLAPRKAIELAVQMAHGLAAAHDKGIIHRDLKPDNLWITKDGRLKILDFGLAKQVGLSGHGSQSFLATQAVGAGQVMHTEEGMILGTMGYMSPEQVRGETVDARSDIFSFGAALFEMLTGKKAFARSTSADTLAAILKEDPPDLEQTSRPIPAGLQRILHRCLEKNSSHRFHDAEDLAFALTNLESGSGSSASFAAPFAPQNLRTSKKWAVLVAVFVLSAGLIGWTLRGKLSPFPSNSPVAVRFLTYSGRDTSPAVSPDGRTIAFSSQRDGQPRIWLKQLRGGGELALTTGPDDFPRFSPDGSSILFIRSEGSGTSLYRMSVLGTDLHKVAEGATYGDWSPDGNRIAYVRTTAEAGSVTSILHLIDAGGGAEKELARFPSAQLTAPRWSPDGSAISLTPDYQNSSGSLTAKIVRVRVRDGAIREFGTVSKFGAISTSVWVSSEEVVYFQAESVTGNGSGTSPSKAYRQNLSTGSVQPLFWAPVSAMGVDILPGGRVVFDGISGRQALREYPLDQKAPPRWLTRGNINDRQPVCSLDGEWVVFSSNRSGNLDLWEVSSRTGVVKSLTDDAAEDWDPGFTPDGKHILWSSNRSGAFEIWMANSDGSGARQVSQDGVDAENPTMTRDGRWVVYISTNPKAPGMWKIHPDGTGAELMMGGTNLSLPEVSPDGRFVSYMTQLNPQIVTLHVLSVENGSKDVFQTTLHGIRKTVATAGRSRWMPDGRHLVFTGQDEKGLDGVFIQDFVPGQDTRATRKPLAGFDPDWITESLGLSPDGTRLVLSESERMFSLLVAEGVTGLPSQRKDVK